jgi:hypothetical protein
MSYKMGYSLTHSITASVVTFISNVNFKPPDTQNTMQTARSHVLTTALYAGERSMPRYCGDSTAVSRRDPAFGVPVTI